MTLLFGQSVDVVSGGGGFASTITFRPPAVSDGNPWVYFSVGEALTSVGPFIPVVESAGLVPIDSDPTDPAFRKVTLRNLSYPFAWYQVVLNDTTSSTSETLPLFSGNLPSPQDVAALLVNRTKEQGGSRAGTFTEKTVPTWGQVAQLIDTAYDTVTGEVGRPSIGSSREPDLRLKDSIKLYAAMLVELTFFGEQVTSGLSPYDQYKTLYDERVMALRRMRVPLVY